MDTTTERQQRAKDGATDDLSGAEAIHKLASLATGRVAMTCTRPSAAGSKLAVRPLVTQAVDADGTLWFLTSKQTATAEHLRQSPDVDLVYGDPSSSTWLHVQGAAKLVDDRAKIAELWTPLARTWFPDGVDDPDVVLVRVTPFRGHYWDTTHGKLVQRALLVASAVVGRPLGGGRDGELEPH